MSHPLDFGAHKFFRSFSIGRITYCLICQYSVVIRVCIILVYPGRTKCFRKRSARKSNRTKPGCSTATCQRAVQTDTDDQVKVISSDSPTRYFSRVRRSMRLLFATLSCHSSCCQCWFSNFFQGWKENSSLNKIHIILPTTPWSCFRTTLRN